MAGLKKQAYDQFKEQKKLSLKEFTALNTAAKSQEARLSGIKSAVTRKTLNEIQAASANRLRYLKYFLYNDASIQSLTRQEKQHLWEALRTRETNLKTDASATVKTAVKPIQKPLFQQPKANRQIVRVTPRSV